MQTRLFDPVRDLDRVLALYQQCFAEPPWFERFDPNELREEFVEMRAWPDAIMLVVEKDDQVIAGAFGFRVLRKPDVCALIPDEDRNSLYVAELFVDPGVRERGICRQLKERLLRLSWAFGYRRLSVRTSVNQPAIQKLFVGHLGAKIVAKQDVVSTKWIDDVEQQVPDTRILMTGALPNFPAIDQAAHDKREYEGCWRR